MILVLSGSGEEAREMMGALKQERIDHLCFFTSFADAGNYGSGNAFVGRLSVQGAKDLLRQNVITGVLDVLTEGNQEQSLVMMEACEQAKVPYVKYLKLQSTFSYDRAEVFATYTALAEAVDKLSGKVLFYARPETVRQIAKRVTDVSRMYVPIPRGIRFDVELALEFGIPLLQVMENDGIDGEDAVRHAIERCGAELLVCDGSGGTMDKLAVAEERGIPILFTHTMGIEYTKVVQASEDAMELARGWAVDRR